MSARVCVCVYKRCLPPSDRRWSYLNSSELNVVGDEPGETVAHEEHHDVPAEHVMSRPADDQTRHEALRDGLDDGGGEHVDAQLRPSAADRHHHHHHHHQNGLKFV